MSITIRAEHSADIAAIGTVIDAAFSNSRHGLNKEPRIVALLRESNALVISLVALSAEQILGHVAISAVTISDGAEGWYGLGPISVRPDHQRRGIGTKLMRMALEALKNYGANGCVLLGDPDIYGRFGFNNIPDLLFVGAPAQYFLALKFGATFPVGEVSYHRAFAVAS